MFAPAGYIHRNCIKRRALIILESDEKGIAGIELEGWRYFDTLKNYNVNLDVTKAQT